MKIQLYGGPKDGEIVTRKEHYITIPVMKVEDPPLTTYSIAVYRLEKWALEWDPDQWEFRYIFDGIR